MGIFNFFSKQDKPIITQPESNSVYSSFSTPLGDIGTGDLTKPYIRSYTTSEPFVRYGNDNLFPQILNQLAVQSGLHGSILKFKANAVIGGGFELTSPDKSAQAKIKEYAFLSKNKFNKLMREITDDLLIHGRMHVLVKNNDGKKSIHRIGPEKVRINEARTLVTISKDWSRSIDKVTYPEYYEGCEVDSVFSYYISSPGGDIYPYVTYQGCLNWAFLSTEISSLQKDNIQNSIYPSYIISTGGKPKTQAEIDALSKSVKTLTEPGKRGKAIVFANQNLDSIPTVQALPTNDIPKAFDTLMKDIREEICTAHQINSAIMGVKTQGQLGATTEIQDSNLIFEKNFIQPTRAELEEYANDLLAICDINATLTIKNLQIIDDKITEIKK